MSLKKIPRSGIAGYHAKLWEGVLPCQKPCWTMEAILILGTNWGTRKFCWFIQTFLLLNLETEGVRHGAPVLSSLWICFLFPPMKTSVLCQLLYRVVWNGVLLWMVNSVQEILLPQTPDYLRLQAHNIWLTRNIQVCIWVYTFFCKNRLRLCIIFYILIVTLKYGEVILTS